MELRDHQEKALETLSNGKILWGGVGTGKSFTAVKYYERMEAPRDVYVITTAKKRDSHDWESEFSHIGVGTEHSVHGRLTVDSWNNLKKYQNVVGAFFIFDEQRLVGSGAWVKAFIRLARRNHWILLSATPGDTWMDYVPVFVANGWYPNKTAFIHEHVVYNNFAKFPKIDRYTGVGKLARYRRDVLVEMPFVRETLREVIHVEVPFDAEALQKVTKDRWHIYEDRPLKDVGELYRVARKVVNSDPRRLAKAAEIIRENPKLIIFYNFDYELELLRSLWDSPTNSYSGTPTATESSSPFETSSVGSSNSSATASSERRAELWTTTPTNPSKNGSFETSERVSTTGSTNSTPSSPRSMQSTDLSSPSTTVGSAASDVWRPGQKRSELWTPGQNGSSGTATAEAAGNSSGIRSTARVGDTSTSTSGGKLWTTSTNSSSLISTVAENSSPLETTRGGSSRSNATVILGDPSRRGSRLLMPSSEITPSAVEPSVSASETVRIATDVAVAEWNGHKHQRIPLEHARWVYLVQYTAGAEGWNCTDTDTMLFYSWQYSYKIFHQSQGRTDRLNTPYKRLKYFVLGGKSWIDLAIRKSLDRKQDFQEVDF